MPESHSLAYALSQVETGWRWQVFDEDGETVGDGAHANRSEALAAVQRVIKSGDGDGSGAGAG